MDGAAGKKLFREPQQATQAIRGLAHSRGLGKRAVEPCLIERPCSQPGRETMADDGECGPTRCAGVWLGLCMCARRWWRCGAQPLQRQKDKLRGGTEDFVACR